MATEHWYSALGFWGVWLFVPILVDGFQSFRYLVATIAGWAAALPVLQWWRSPRSDP